MVAVNVVERLRTTGNAEVSRRDVWFDRIKSHTEQCYRVLQHSWIHEQNRWEINVLSAIADAWTESGIPEGKVLFERVAVMKVNLRRYAFAESHLLKILSLAGNCPTTNWEILKFLRFASGRNISAEDLCSRLLDAGITPQSLALIGAARSEADDPHLVYVSKDAIIAKMLEPIDHVRDHLLREAKSRGQCEHWMIRVLGYDDDPRGLYDIPEVRAWCGKALAALPFLPVVLEFDTFQWLAFCLVPTETTGDTGYVQASPMAIIELLQRARDSLGQIFRDAEIDGGENIADRCMYQVLASLGLPGLDQDDR